MARRRLLKSYFYIVYNGVAYGSAVEVLPFDETGSTDSFKVVSNRAWAVSGCPSWATLDVESGNPGETLVTITVGQNQGTSSKNGQITIKTLDDRYTGTLSITQMGSEPYITVSPSAETVSFRSIESQVFTVSSRGGWTLVMTGDASASTTDYSQVTGTTSLTISYAKNTTNADKQYVATLTSKADSSIVKTITITHKAQSEIDLTYSGSTIIPYTGETGSIGVITNIGGIIEIPAAAQSHIAVSKVTGLTDGDILTYTASTLDSGMTAGTGYVYAISAKTTDYEAADGIDSDSVSFIYEPYPFINAVSSTTIGSGATGGTMSYTSNYGVEVSNASQGLTVSIVGGNIEYSLPQNTSWNDETYTFDISTIPYSVQHQDGVRGPVISETVSITREGKVAYIEAQNKSVSSSAGTYYIDVDTNDTFTVSFGTVESWISVDHIDGNRVYFDVLENTGTASRDVQITFTTTHDGELGTPAEATVTLTQSEPGITNIPTAASVKLTQGSNGNWDIKVHHDVAGASIPITFTYAGDSVTVTATTADVTASTPWNTAVGTDINTSLISCPSAYTVGNTEYDITYTFTTEPLTPTVQVDADATFYQDSVGDWWIVISHDEPGVTIPMEFNYSGISFTVSATTTEVSAVTPWNTAVGTDIDVSQMGYEDTYVIGGTEYEVTCSISSVAYSEETTLDDYSIDISYDVDEIPASGGESDPSVTVYYSATTTPSFGDPESFTGETSLDDMEIDGTGDINADGSVSADTRGTETGDTETIATITAVTGTITINGEEFPVSDDTSGTLVPISITQEANDVETDINYISANTTPNYVSSSTEYDYDNEAVWFSPTGASFYASGGSEDVSAYYSYEMSSTTIDHYEDTIESGFSAYTAYTSGERFEEEVFEYDTEERDDYGEPVYDYIEEAFDPEDIEISPQTDPDYISYSDGTVTAEDLLDNITNGEILTLYVEHPIDSNVTETADFIQEANTFITASTETPYTDTAITDTRIVTAYTSYVHMDQDEDDFYANGISEDGNTAITITAGEDWTATTTEYDTITTSSWTVTEIVSSYTSNYTASTTVTGIVSTSSTEVQGATGETSGTEDLTSYISATTATHIHYSNGEATADNLGTTVTTGETIYLGVRGIYDTGQTGTGSVTQEANVVEGTGYTEGMEESAITSCTRDAFGTTAVTFDPDHMEIAGITVESHVDVETSTVAYPTTSYTSGDILTGDTPTIVSSSTQTISVEPEFEFGDGPYEISVNVSVTETATGVYSVTFTSDYDPFNYNGDGSEGYGYFVGASGDCVSDDVYVYVNNFAPQNTVGVDYDVTQGTYASFGIGVDPLYDGRDDVHWTTTFDYEISLRNTQSTVVTAVTGTTYIEGDGNDDTTFSSGDFIGPVVRHGVNAWFDYYPSDPNDWVVDVSVDNVSTTYTTN